MSNLRTIYSPLGEKFEVSEPNFIDLTRHVGWTESRPHPDDVAAKVALLAGTAAPETLVPAADPVVETTPPAADAPVVEAVVEAVVEDVTVADEAPVAKTEPHHFADMDREAVKAHITTTFPEAAIDGRSGRDALVAQAIELAKA